MNLQSPARLIRACNRAGRTISAIGYNTQVSGGNVFQESVVNCQFLTPSLDIPLPPKSVVPYMEFPRYITQYQNGTIAPGAVGQIVSQTITLPAIPDLLLIYAKPNTGSGVNGAFLPSDADFYLPVATSLDAIRNPLSINFDNFSGLLSSHTAEELYAMSVKNGLDMDWNSWSGQAKSSGGTYTFAVQTPAPATITRQQGQTIPSVGSILVLKPSQDITLQSGQAPSLEMCLVY